MHNNMITINGQKMGKSLGNFITLDEFFTGSHKDKDGKEMLEQPYSPMTIRFFILQAHYRSTVDFSNEALQASEKGFAKLMEAYKKVESGKLKVENEAAASGELSTLHSQLSTLRSNCYEAMNDDFNTPIVISHLFDAARIINQANDGKIKLTQADIDELKGIFDTFLFDIMGMKDESASDNTALIDGLMHIILDIRATAKANKDWATSDKIRDALKEAGVTVKDGKDGATWQL
jgi:cysteinyl-tRNA synthetase